MLAGFAEVDFTPPPGLNLLGQMHARRAERARDPLMATACALQSSGQTMVLLSVDICILPLPFAADVQEMFERETGIPARSLLIHATHTHDAPSVIPLLSAPPDPTFVEQLRRSIVDAARRAIADLRPVQIFAGSGTMEHLGWNRRAMFKDGSSRMYGHSEMPGFEGIEGPRDPTLSLLVARDEQGVIAGIILNFSSHPNCIENASVYSADLPGAARRALRRLLDAPVPIVYLTGAAGNTAPSLLDPHVPEQPWRGEDGLERSGIYLAGEAGKIIAGCWEPMIAPALDLAQEVISLPLRNWPASDDANYPEPLKTDSWADAVGYYRAAEADWPRLVAGDSPEPLRLSVLRVGDAAICFNPAELFVEYGLEIRAESPARVTMIAELTDGYAGYVPTRRSLGRGGYETWPAPTSRLSVESGEKIVQSTRRLLKRAFNDRPRHSP